MTMIRALSIQRMTRLLAALAVTTALATGTATQTKITAPSNSYDVSEDVKLGQEAAAQARKELPLLKDERLDAYVSDIGQKLAGAIPTEFRHSEFHYTFEVVNESDINAFALPAGPMFLNRGMMEKAHSEGEVAGVMAHEMSHVALRHGTAQATKGQKFQIGAIAGQVLGAIVGGTAGSIISQGTQFGLGTYFLKFSREYESQADILGAQMMARAGYDPREMANMFKTIEQEGGASGPEFLSDHPNPGNRYNRILDEAKSLRVTGNADSGQFAAMQTRLKGMGRSYTAQEIAEGKAKANTSSSMTGTSGRTAVQVAAPSSTLRAYQPTQFMRVSVPQNWSPSGGSNSVTYAPEGAVFQSQNGGSAFTHGVQFGVAQGTSGNLQRDTQALLQSFAKSNPDLKQTASLSRVTISGRNGLTTQLSNKSEVTGQPEVINFTTAYLRDGSLFYMIGVAPQAEAQTYTNAFNRVRSTIQLSDR